MCERFEDPKSSPLLKLMGAALIASLSAACSSDALRLSDSPFSNPFNAKLNDSMTTGSVAGSSGRYSAPKTSMPSIPSLPKATAMGNTPVIGNANGWSATGGTPVTVGSGDTIEALSGRYGVPVAALRSVNGMNGGDQPSAGEQFIIPAFNPGTGAKTSVPSNVVAQAAPRYQSMNDAAPAVRNTARAQVRNAVGANNQDEDETPVRAAPQPRQRSAAPVYRPLEPTPQQQAAQPQRSAKQVKAPTYHSLNEQQAKAKPKVKVAPVADDEEDDTPAKVAQAPKATPKLPSKAVASTRKVEPVKAAKAPVKSDEEITTGSVATTSEPAKVEQEFRWPARGRVISGFGSRSTSGTNDGLNIAVPEGTAVKATETGTVAYAGEEIKGYGKMVLIRHANGYVSAYAHNGELNVRRGETVKRGQVIAKSGQTGNVTSPQLHFELRKGADPVDPSKYLE